MVVEERGHIFIWSSVFSYKIVTNNISDVTLVSEDGGVPMGHRVVLSLVSSLLVILISNHWGKIVTNVIS